MNTIPLDDLRTSTWYTLRFVARHQGTRCEYITPPMLLQLVTFEKGKPCQLRFWSKELGGLELSWLDIVRLEVETVKARIAE